MSHCHLFDVRSPLDRFFPIVYSVALSTAEISAQTRQLIQNCMGFTGGFQTSPNPLKS